MDISKGLGSIEAQKGRVTCPGLNCKSVGLSDKDICRYAPDAFEAYKAAKEAMLTKTVRESAIAEERQRAEEEQKRLAKLSADERKLLRFKTRIIEDILTLRCPRCKAAFDDFEGCFSLTCRCKASFCAMCLEDCGADAHAHVAQCQEGQGLKQAGYFGSKESFVAIQKRRRERLVKEYIRTKIPQEDRGRVVQRCEIELRDLGILQAVARDFPPPPVRRNLPVPQRGGGQRQGDGRHGPAAGAMGGGGAAAAAGAGGVAAAAGAQDMIRAALAADEAFARQLQEQMDEEVLGGQGLGNFF